MDGVLHARIRPFQRVGAMLVVHASLKRWPEYETHFDAIEAPFEIRKRQWLFENKPYGFDMQASEAVKSDCGRVVMV